jgi:putative ABC transport system permease protein
VLFKAGIVEALRACRSAPLRSALALVGIVAGIGSIVGMVATTTMAREKALSLFGDMGSNSVLIHMKSKQGRHGSALDYLRGLPDVFPEIDKQATSGFLEYGPIHGGPGTQFKSVLNVGLLEVSADFDTVLGLSMRRGRFLHPLDRDRAVCVLGADVAEKLITQADQIVGSSFIYNGQYMTVIGVLDRNTKLYVYGSLDLNSSVISSPAAIKRLFNRNQTRPETIVQLKDKTEVAEISSRLESYFRQNDMKVEIWYADKVVEMAQKQFLVMTLLLGLVAGFSMLVGGVGVMNVMLVSIMERAREIGIRRAVGANKTDIMMQFLLESIVLCFVGGLLGSGAGLLISLYGSMIYEIPFQVSSKALWAGCGTSIGASLFFGFYPAWRAAKLNPAAALRRG